MFFFFFFVIELFCFTNEDLVVGVFSGKEVLTKRVLGQAETWFNQFPKIFVFSDCFPNKKEIENIKTKALHTNISFIEIKDTAEHLKGTEWTDPWYPAQTRFLPGMKELYEWNKETKWFLICDDDTYLFARNIERRLHKYDYNKPVVVSYFYCTWNKIIEQLDIKRDCMPFAQGGSGVLFSQKMMEMLSSHLINCSDKYNNAEHAASMRLAACIQNLYGVENWTNGAFIKPWRSGFHSNPPEIEIEKGNTWDSPGSFHKVNKENMKRIYNAHICNIENKNYYYDFSYNSFVPTPVELTYNTNWEFNFGYNFDMYGLHSSYSINATSPILCDKEDEEFHQNYENGVKVILHCNKNLEDGEMYSDYVERSPFNTIVHIQLKCPEKTYFYQ